MTALPDLLGKSGDLAPRKECAPAWRERLLAQLPRIQLTLVIGQYAQGWHLDRKSGVTDTVRNWKATWPEIVPLPHPSPRNNIWMKKNSWFEKDVLEKLPRQVAKILQQ